MKEYIDKEQLLDRLKTIKDSKEWDSQSEYVMYGIEQFIGKAPAADVVERKRGEWVELEEADYLCTACGWEGTVCCAGKDQNRRGRVHFCPNCGADMRRMEDANV